MSKTKQAFLRAIAIKLEVDAHKKYRKIMSRIFWLLFVIFLGYGLYNSISRHIYSDEILNDAVYLEAEFEELSDYISDTQSSYRYSFNANGTSYQKEFVSSHKNLNKYMGNDGIKIAYKKSDPLMSGVAAVLERNNGFGAIIKHFAKMFFFGGLGFLVINMFLTQGIVQPKVEYDDDEID